MLMHAEFTVDAFWVASEQFKDPGVTREGRCVILVSGIYWFYDGGRKKDADGKEDSAVYGAMYFKSLSVVHDKTFIYG